MPRDMIYNEAGADRAIRPGNSSIFLYNPLFMRLLPNETIPYDLRDYIA